jgi:hypothetical protein
MMLGNERLWDKSSPPETDWRTRSDRREVARSLFALVYAAAIIALTALLVWFV